MTLFGKPRSRHVHWLFWSYEAKDVMSQTAPYLGVVPIDVIASSYDEALGRVEKIVRRSGDRHGYELKSVSEHVEGHCKV